MAVRTPWLPSEGLCGGDELSSHHGPRRSLLRCSLCRSYRYQNLGYYVSLLAAARGHKPWPNMITMREPRLQTLVRFVADDLDELMQKCLAPWPSDTFVLSIYFGHNLAKRYERLSLHLCNLY